MSARYRPKPDIESECASVRTVQFGTTEVQKTKAEGEEDDEDEEDEEEDKEVIESTVEQKEEDEFAGMSWNERMRHQAQPLMATQIRSCLDPVICFTFTSVLIRCVEALAIVRQTNRVPFLDVNVDYVSPHEKFKVSEIFELDTIIHDDYLTLTYGKFRRDISWLEKVLKIAIDNMKKNWLFDNFVKVVDDYQLMRDDEDTLLAAKKFNQSEIAKMRMREDEARRYLMINLQELTEEVGHVKDKLNDEMILCDIKTRFLQNWEDARYEQNKMILESQEKAYIETTKQMNIEIERENRVHEELETYIEESFTDYQDEIEKWMDKYDHDMEELEIKIGTLRMEVEKQRDKYVLLTEKFEYQRQMIEEYKEERRLRLQAEEEEENRRLAATKIQSWWRGVMFRKGLGPFRRKKGKGKQGSGKNSGKKKK